MRRKEVLRIGKYHIKCNRNVPIIKRHYFLSLIFFIPPFHELGHVIICHLTGAEITQINWFSVVWHTATPHDWMHEMWEYSPFITLLMVILFCYQNIKNVELLKLSNGIKY